MKDAKKLSDKSYDWTRQLKVQKEGKLTRPEMRKQVVWRPTHRNAPLKRASLNIFFHSKISCELLKIRRFLFSLYNVQCTLNRDYIGIVKVANIQQRKSVLSPFGLVLFIPVFLFTVEAVRRCCHSSLGTLQSLIWPTSPSPAVM